VKTMAEVLGEHRISAHFTCECGSDFFPDDEDLDEDRGDSPTAFIEAYEAHQADALTAAGFGPVKAAQAGALREAADAMTRESPGAGPWGTPQYEHQAGWLRARAASIEADQ
jgi:hypothetical protein